MSLEHVHLTSFSKMCVDLAAQVMSDRVSKAMLLTGGSEAFETSVFLGKVDKFFDSLNVTKFTSGRRFRKKFQMPYFRSDDFRLEYLSEFVAYLKSWRASVDKRPGFKKNEKKMMLLPKETLDGVNITVSSFCEFIPYIFSIPGVSCFLSCKINQDPIKKFFGVQRQAGRVNENPNVTEFIKNTENIRVIGGIFITNILGNCRGRKHDDLDIQLAMQPLRKRKKKKSV